MSNFVESFKKNLIVIIISFVLIGVSIFGIYYLFNPPSKPDLGNISMSRFSNPFIGELKPKRRWFWERNDDYDVRNPFDIE